jgi:hypothetical protein
MLKGDQEKKPNQAHSEVQSLHIRTKSSSVMRNEAARKSTETQGGQKKECIIQEVGPVKSMSTQH